VIPGRTRAPARKVAVVPGLREAGPCRPRRWPARGCDWMRIWMRCWRENQPGGGPGGPPAGGEAVERRRVGMLAEQRQGAALVGGENGDGGIRERERPVGLG
jgi:hypothetical protein